METEKGWLDRAMSVSDGDSVRASVQRDVDALTGDFSGVVSVSRGAEILFERAYGMADRRHGVAATTDTMFAIASGSKGFTASAVTGLIHDGALDWDTRVRAVIGDDLPLIADDVTVEHLLAHRSGIGDYLDEALEDDWPSRVRVQDLIDTADFLPFLDGFPTSFGAGERFAYCNGGFVVLALIAERVANTPFHDLVANRVFTRAGMGDTGFLRSDLLPGRAAVGYLDDGRTNVFQLPVRGSGDGGAYSTVSDMRAFWSALFAGRILPSDVVARMVTPTSEVPESHSRYGLGFWLHADGPAVYLDGADHGVSFRSAHDPSSGLTWTVVSNTTDCAWPIAKRLMTRLGDQHADRSRWGYG
jgi:CubicO group peptidase (beta-lactamase class C family)